MKRLERFLLLALCFLGFFAASAKAQLGGVDRDAETKPVLVILGTYHMGTPGSNVVKPEVADVGTPQRQKQMVELVERLKRFKPTKIVLEIDWDKETKTQDLYDKYLAGNYELTKNETNQIGFRLAKELGHKKVYCVDWSDFWDDPTINYEKFAAKDSEMDAYLKGVYQKLKKEIDAEFERIYSMAIVDQLIFLNKPERAEKDHRIYFNILRLGRGTDYAGANYVSWWYRRNLTIFTNIVRLTESPNDRVLVVYGVGHNKLLNQFAKESGFYEVESPLKYLENKKSKK